jgi:CubicO group peptidase (beta-lactamase class C family)
LAVINGGQAGAKQIIDPVWLKRMTTPVTKLDYNWGYGAFVWHPFPGISQAEGLHGQYIFMNPKTRTVIVKLSDNPTGLDETVATAKVMRDVSNKLN